jgi:hypothetical protein
MKDKPYDILVFELQKEGKSEASISIKYEDLDIMLQNDIKIGDILEDMLLQMENGISEKKNTSNEKDTCSF